MKVRVATRKSALALAQTRATMQQLKTLHPELVIEELQIVTQGDRFVDRPLYELGGKGLFVTEIEIAVADNRADLAVHSLKDLPAKLHPQLVLACLPPREDPRDVLISRDGSSLTQLPSGARIGTGALRRIGQLREQRQDLQFEPLRGNVDTRLRRLDAGDFDAIVLAMAGLRRLGLQARASWPIPVEVSIPCVGQGVLALQTRKDDSALRALLQSLECPMTRLAVEAERTFLDRLEGDCRLPVAGFASIEAQQMTLSGMVGSADAQQIIREQHSTPVSTLDDARALGITVADRLLARGAQTYIEQARNLRQA